MTQTALKLVIAAFVTLSLASCMQQTVRDAHGNIIYQEPVIGTPWQSEARTQKQIHKREEQLGWR